jgi:hypothetical protein
LRGFLVMEKEIEAYTIHEATIGDSELNLAYQGDDRYGRRMTFIDGPDLELLRVPLTMHRHSDQRQFFIARVDKSFRVVWLAEKA